MSGLLHKLELVAGKISAAILSGFITTARQYGFEIKSTKNATNYWEEEKISFQKANKVLVPVAKKAKLSIPTEANDNDEDESQQFLGSSYEES